MAIDVSCPRCADPRIIMDKVVSSRDKRVVMDVCGQCHGVWLDRAELELIAERGCTVVANPVANMKLAVGGVPGKGADGGVDQGAPGENRQAGVGEQLAAVRQGVPPDGTADDEVAPPQFVGRQLDQFAETST